MSIFDSIATKTAPESLFDLSRETKLSMNMGELVPILLEEIVPGDTFKVNSQILIRLAPMLAPVMHRVNVYVHYFFVPTRLVWDNFHDHITGGEDGLANPVHPFVTINETNRSWYEAGKLADYLGVPTVEPAVPVVGDHNISAIPFRGYQLIYNEYFRDQDLSPKASFQTTDGEDTAGGTLQIRNRAWEKDYLTSCRPNAQKGPTVNIPLSGTLNPTYKTPAQWVPEGAFTPGGLQVPAASPLDITDTAGNPGTVDNLDQLDLTSVGMSVEDQRKSNRLQEWLELASRGGSRINEVIRNFFGVSPDDLRLTRPQYLGGGKQSVIMSEVLNTAGDTGDTLQPLGEYGGHGISVGNSNSFHKAFKEHGYVYGIMSVLPKTNYQQGLHRHWQKFDKYEKYWPQFAQLGEQEVKQSEAKFDLSETDILNAETFGYAPKYAEYKYGQSTVHGDFRKDNTGDKLSYWTMHRYFDNKPALNHDFITSDPTHRIFAVTDPAVHKLYVQIYHKIKAKRKMPYYNLPSMVG